MKKVQPLGQLPVAVDHVCVQLLTAPDADVLDGYRRLAQALGL